MAVSLNEFKEKFRNYLLEIHWKQWSALGVASHIPSEKHWIIDVEALLASTLAIGLCDKRLLTSCVEWWIKNGEWVNYARLKRIFKDFMSLMPNSKELLLNSGVVEILSDTIERLKPIAKKFPKINVSEEILLQEYEKVFGAFQIRDIVKQMEILKPPSLLQLLLRSYFGIEASVEVLVYLLIHNAGNSNEIAKKIHHSQRNIYTILERWVKAGMLTKVNRKYSLNKEKEWFRILGLKKNCGYLNWVRTFLFLDQLLKVFSSPQWSDEYSLSSLFRDFFNEAVIIGHSLNIAIPEQAGYKGAQYFEPFASAVLNILENIKAS